MRRRKALLSIIIISAVLYGLLIASSANKQSKRLDIENKVVSFIEKNEKNGAAHINFQKDIGISYDKAYIFPPYTSDNELKKHLGNRSAELKSYGLTYRDDISLLVFVKSDQIVHVVKLPAKYKVTPDNSSHTPYLIQKSVKFKVNA
ncbi:hypothetical protein [Falsibacillus pallidus]|uniref:hypothetical protein n=1 Tax=Falsibacillus pallidus TaxID=493781 RepID=UPI003D99C5AD